MNPRLSYLVIANAMAVLFIGLVAGLGLTFSLMEAVGLWPLPVWEVQIPGSTRGWQAAHVGGILNGVMIPVLVWLATYLQTSDRQGAWIGWGMILTGWGNTLFYWAGNLSSNRGLSVADTRFGEGDLWGALAYLGGGTAMVFTFIAVTILGSTAWKAFRQAAP